MVANPWSDIISRTDREILFWHSINHHKSHRPFQYRVCHLLGFSRLQHSRLRQRPLRKKKHRCGISSVGLLWEQQLDLLQSFSFLMHCRKSSYRKLPPKKWYTRYHVFTICMKDGRSNRIKWDGLKATHTNQDQNISCLQWIDVSHNFLWVPAEIFDFPLLFSFFTKMIESNFF